MFLDKMISRNPQLIDTAFSLHQKGLLMPDSYVVDVDSFMENAGVILKTAKAEHIKLYFMIKQLGRNPYLAKKLLELGYESAVAVDYKEAQLMMKHQIPLGNAGHLVQIPDQMLGRIISYGSEVITVYSMAKILRVNEEAKACNKVQKILIRVYCDTDLIYSGQTAGIPMDNLQDVVRLTVKSCSHVVIAGVTSFPCYLYQENVGEFLPTRNLDTVIWASRLLKQWGVEPEIINTPSATCSATLKRMSHDGGNCGEPGHGLTGTTPGHAYSDMEEKPCVVYVSEISHNFCEKGYCFGGGYYRRSHIQTALTGKSFESSERVRVKVPDLESIDYHFELEKPGKVGDIVLMAFRFQIFVTRSDVVLVKGISCRKPEIIGVYDSLGNDKWENA